MKQVTQDLIKNSIILNNSCFIQSTGTQYIPVGDGTEVGLLNFLQRADLPIHHMIHDKQRRVAMMCPHSSANKFSANLIKNETDGGGTIYLKGAPEIIVKERCGNFCDADGELVGMNEDVATRYNNALEKFTKTKGLRVIAFAKLDLDNEAFEAALTH